MPRILSWAATNGSRVVGLQCEQRRPNEIQFLGADAPLGVDEEDNKFTSKQIHRGVGCERKRLTGRKRFGGG